jgi:hypothetical protein
MTINTVLTISGHASCQIQGLRSDVYPQSQYRLQFYTNILRQRRYYFLKISGNGALTIFGFEPYKTQGLCSTLDS